MVKIYTPDDNRKGISQGLDNSLLAPIQANIESSEKIINQSNSQIQSQSSILQSKSDLAAINQRDRDNYRIGLQKALVAADRRDKVLRSETVGVDKTTEYSKYISDAMLQFTELSEKRKSMAVDENGNPMHDSLAKDTGKLGEMVKGRISSNIKDPLLKEKFDLEFGEFVTKSQIASYTTARAQRTEYNRTELGNSLTKLVDVGVRSGFETSGDSLAQAQRLVNSAVSHGVDVSTGNAMLESFKTELVSGKMNALITTDINKAKEVLNNNTPEALGMDPKMYLGYKVKVDSTWSAIEGQKAAGIELDIKNRDIVTEAQLQNKLNTVAPEFHKELIYKFNTESGKLTKEYIAAKGITERLEKGIALNLGDEPAVTTTYNEALKSISVQGNPPSIYQEAQIAGQFKGAPVKPFAARIDSIYEYGTPEEQLEAVKAFDTAKTLNPQSVIGVSKDTITKIGMIKEVAKNSSSAPDKILERVEDKLGKAPEQVRDLRKTFKDKYITKNKNTVSESLRSFVKDFDVTYLGEADIDPDAQAMYAESIQDHFARNGGNYNAAVASANMENSQGQIGFSTFGGVDRIVRNPIEMQPGLAEFGVKRLEGIFTSELKSLNLDPDISKYRLLADNQTRGRFDANNNEVISYRIVKIEGNSVIEVRKNGEPARFAPTKEDLKAQIRLEQEELKNPKRELPNTRESKNPFSVETRFGQ